MNIDFEKYTGIAVLVRLGAVFFIFALFLGGTTMGMQWFSHSLGKFFLSQVRSWQKKSWGRAGRSRSEGWFGG